jgi:very-short-patch-repair endonuclease
VDKPSLVNKARALRHRETAAEQIIWSWLRDNKIDGVKFRRQQPIGIYIVDFVSFEKKLIIEIDGGQHNFEMNKTEDEARKQWLESQGFRVIRFWNNEVSSNLEGVILQIEETLRGHPHPVPLPSKGEGTKIAKRLQGGPSG